MTQVSAPRAAPWARAIFPRRRAASGLSSSPRDLARRVSLLTASAVAKNSRPRTSWAAAEVVVEGGPVRARARARTPRLARELDAAS